MELWLKRSSDWSSEWSSTYGLFWRRSASLDDGPEGHEVDKKLCPVVQSDGQWSSVTLTTGQHAYLVD